MSISSKEKTILILCVYSDINECLTSNGGCEQNCNNTEGSFSCFCASGLSLDSNGLNCSGKFLFYSCNLVVYFSLTDNNECLVNNGDCEHTCTNSEGNFSCSCNTGYSLDDNERNCTGEYNTVISTIL